MPGGSPLPMCCTYLLNSPIVVALGIERRVEVDEVHAGIREMCAVAEDVEVVAVEELVHARRQGSWGGRLLSRVNFISFAKSAGGRAANGMKSPPDIPLGLQTGGHCAGVGICGLKGRGIGNCRPLVAALSQDWRIAARLWPQILIPAQFQPVCSRSNPRRDNSCPVMVPIACFTGG